MRKNNMGVTLIALAATIVVLTILSVTLTMSLKSTIELKKYYSTKQDILALSEAVQRYYLTSNGNIGDIVTGDVMNGDFIKNAKDKNPNDNDEYYKINTDSSIMTNVILKNETNTYLVNIQSLTVYCKEGYELNGQMHYTAVDDFAGGSFATDYYNTVDAPIISVVTLEGNGTDPLHTTAGDTVTLKMLSSYNFDSYTAKPTIELKLGDTILTPTTGITYDGKIATVVYTLGKSANNSGKTLEFTISGYSVDGRIGETITKPTFTDGVIYNYSELAKSDGSWSDTKKVNTPKITGTGLVPVTLATDGTATEVTDLSSDWYDYNTTANSSRWANAVTKDSSGKITGYFVWIPRYAYKITSGCNTNTTGAIEVKFLKGTTDKDSTDTTISENYPSVTSGAMSDYVVHPAFTSNINNGGWSEATPGFWVAKYPAGYQASTVNASGTLQNSSDTVVRSNINYSGINYSYTANAVDSSLSTSTKISYPVFKPLTYAYDCIRIGDMYTLARDIQNASAFYGLSGIDSHMEKNSEWGAVVYLTQSSYGRNGTEVNINNMNFNNLNSKNINGVTGVYGAGTSDSEVTAIGSVNAYNTSTGVKGSSTGNITGVYDLNGCLCEYTAGYIKNGNASLSTYGASFATATTSTKYATVYPYNSSTDSNTNNYTQYSSSKTSTYGFGDAILETSNSGSGSTSWNSDYSYFPITSTPFFVRAGYWSNTTDAGEFYFNNGGGNATNLCCFRVVLV